jgi:ring-1,2-phenylacetyl-CoA epoxidase subunit PaaD
MAMTEQEQISIAKVRQLMEEVNDPEVPVLSVVDLGIVRDIIIRGDLVEVVITPTYSGCPAMDVIAMNIKMILIANGFRKIKITTVLSPAWTTDWMTPSGKNKLKAFGIAPPPARQQVCHTELFHDGEAVQCPHCDSYNTRLVSRFGSTPCKALYVCRDCEEPFDLFKCH